MFDKIGTLNRIVEVFFSKYAVIRLFKLDLRHARQLLEKAQIRRKELKTATKNQITKKCSKNLAQIGPHLA